MTPVANVSPSQELRAVGLRATNQRALVLSIIRQSEGHLDAEEIYAAAREQDASLSLATVYRALRALRGAGLVQQRYFGSSHSHDHYEASGEAEHYHFTCVRCGEVYEFDTPVIRRLSAELERKHGWKVRHTVFLLEGVCSACASGSAGEAPAPSTV
jgi:Fur family ferric uptake transcriptional regulator